MDDPVEVILAAAQARQHTKISLVDSQGPILEFILLRRFDRFAKVIAYDFLIDMYELCELKIVRAAIHTGCIHVEIEIQDEYIRGGIDIRSAIVENAAIRDIFQKYDVGEVVFKNFPGNINYKLRIRPIDLKKGSHYH
jgi:hypothetical protein